MAFMFIHMCVFIDFCVFLQVHRKYTGEDFDEDLRTVLRRSGCKNEKIAFIMDESNVLDSGFLERMNTLLANGEVTYQQQRLLHSDSSSLFAL